MEYKIVICDDEQDILDITQAILEDEGYNIVAVNDSLKVEQIIKDEQPHLLIIDLWMPGLSGDQIVSNLRKRQTISELPIIIISASQDGKRVALASGANAFLRKPYDIDDLLEIVHMNMATA